MSNKYDVRTSWLLLGILLLTGSSGGAIEWLESVPLSNGTATVTTPADGRLYFLRFGSHAYAPEARTTAAPVLVAPFQQLWLEPREFSNRPLKIPAARSRDAFWDQVIVADRSALGSLPHYAVKETGAFGAALPAEARAISLSPGELARQEAGLTDPVIPGVVDREIAWGEMEARALPLDFQKVLLASPHDPSPGFAYQNGQWFTTWLSRDLPQWNKEDHWFAPALLIQGVLVRPAPLSAHTAFVTTREGVTVPLWTLEWTHQGTTVHQRLFSFQPTAQTAPQVFVKFELVNAPTGARLALGVGRRPNAHYWDDSKRPRTPAPFFSLAPRYSRSGKTVLDAWGNAILSSAQAFELEPLGPLESLLVFETGRDGWVHLQTPQTEKQTPAPVTAKTFSNAETAFLELWSHQIEAGAKVRLPSREWTERIHIWRSQVEGITRVHYQRQDRLSYGAYFYQYYFGVEEAWPVMGLALWGQGEEAQRQAGIMLEPENLGKTNVHHQSRNGIAPLAAATVARLTNDREWLQKIAPALRECADWTAKVCSEDNGKRPALTRGLLPPHIYGGDVRDPATSLYATALCWRGMQATAQAFQSLGEPSLAAEGAALSSRAEALRHRLSDVFREVTDERESPGFIPFALALPSLGGKNEGPYKHLTTTRYGNYWNLFAPSFLELDFRDPAALDQPNRRIFEYARQHGGQWAGLPRFYAGLDAAYSAGYIGYLIDRCTSDISYRPQALAALQGFMLHGASRNGYTIPEVAGLFPYRLQRKAYEQLVRESPWSFGMYDSERYLQGHISFTEPLGAVAGAALMLLRNALVSETRNDLGQPDGGLVLLPAVPADWLEDGKEIVLKDMPTYYGAISATVRSRVSRQKEIVLDYRFKPFPAYANAPLRFRARFVPPGEKPQEITFRPLGSGALRAQF